MQVVKHSAEENHDELRGDAITETARQGGLSFVIEVGKFFEVAVLDEELRNAFLRGHAGPDFRHDQTYVVINTHPGADVTSGGDESVVAVQQIRDQGVVQIIDGWKRVERAFREGAFGSGARG